MQSSAFSKLSLRSGFTLIETLFAILIFSAALISLMTIAGRGIGATKTAREQVTAYYLAQEGLEVARNIRDTNFVTNTPWDTGLTDCVGSNCQVVYGASHDTTPYLETCSNNCTVYMENQAYVDNDTNAVDTGYRRAITLELTRQGEYLVTSRVSWNARNIPRVVELSTILKQWR